MAPAQGTYQQILPRSLVQLYRVLQEDFMNPDDQPYAMVGTVCATVKGNECVILTSWVSDSAVARESISDFYYWLMNVFFSRLELCT